MHTSGCLDPRRHRCAVGVAHGLCTTAIISQHHHGCNQHHHHRHRHQHHDRTTNPNGTTTVPSRSKRIMNGTHTTCECVRESVRITKTPTVTTHSPTSSTGKLHATIFLLVRSSFSVLVSHPRWLVTSLPSHPARTRIDESGGF